MWKLWPHEVDLPTRLLGNHLSFATSSLGLGFLDLRGFGIMISSCFNLLLWAFCEWALYNVDTSLLGDSYHHSSHCICTMFITIVRDRIWFSLYLCLFCIIVVFHFIHNDIFKDGLIGHKSWFFEDNFYNYRFDSISNDFWEYLVGNIAYRNGPEPRIFLRIWLFWYNDCESRIGSSSIFHKIPTSSIYSSNQI